MIPKLLSSTSLTGTRIYNAKGEHIGNIEDIMIDWRNGVVGYCVLSVGGFLGIGNKLFAVPMQAFRKDPQERERLYLDIDKERLENAPGFDKDNWPTTFDETFVGTVYDYYAIRPYWLVEETV